MGLVSNFFYSFNEFQFYNEDTFQKSNIIMISSNSSSWSQTWGINAIGEDLVIDSSKNVYIIGVFYLDPDEPIFNVKFDKNGQERWNRTWKLNINWTSITGLAVDTEQNIYNLVTLHSYEDTSVLMKINSSGNSIWNKTFNGDATVIYIDDYDNILVSGRNWDWKEDEMYIFLNKFNKNGICQWNYSFLLDKYIEEIGGTPRTIMVDQLNNTYIAGEIWSMGAINRVFTCSYNSSGHLISCTIRDTGRSYVSSSMVYDKSCNLYLIGINQEETHNKILKYDLSWELQSTTHYPNIEALGERSELFNEITLDLYNNQYCCGQNHFYSGTEIYIAKFNSSGLDFIGAWNNISSARCYDIKVDSELNIYITGSTGVGFLNKRALILKNPVLGEFSNPPIPINISYIISISSFVFVCGMAGIYFVIHFRRRSLE
jgi:hypothetical protein